MWDEIVKWSPATTKVLLIHFLFRQSDLQWDFRMLVFSLWREIVFLVIRVGKISKQGIKSECSSQCSMRRLFMWMEVAETAIEREMCNSTIATNVIRIVHVSTESRLYQPPDLMHVAAVFLSLIAQYHCLRHRALHIIYSESKCMRETVSYKCVWLFVIWFVAISREMGNGVLSVSLLVCVYLCALAGSERNL